MKKCGLLLSFIIPFICLILIFISNGIILGDNSIFISDSLYQYQQLLIYFKSILENLSNFSYSFQISFGTPMISTIAYYLTSPFNILLYFFDNIENFFIFQTLIKLSLCGLTMYKYLTYHNKSNSALIFSTAYALSSFMICNYFQMMWLDSYFLAPLLLLGIDKIINEKKHLLYGIVLFLIVLSNYYNGFICALFGVLYFVYKYILNDIKDKKIVSMFFITSILCGLMTMFIHIPNLLDIMTVNRTNHINYLFNSDFSGIISKMFLGSSNGNILNVHHPYLYIGIFNIILLIFYFINKEITKKEKVLASIIFLILICSIIYVPLNNLWHAFSNPIGFNFRYMFLFNIFTISLCFKSFLNIKKIDKIYYLWTLLFFIVLSFFVTFRELFDVVYLYISIGFFIVYLIMLYIDDKDMKMLFHLLVIAELFFNGYALLKSYDYTPRDYINGVYNEKTSTIEMINDDGFYRMEFDKRFGSNDSLNYGFNGLSNFFSSVDFNEDFYRKIGSYSRKNRVFYNHSIVMDSLLGIKYYESLEELDYYNLIGNNKVSILEGILYGTTYQDSYVYQNPYALSLGYMISSKSKDDIVCLYGYDCQNEILNQMIGYDNNVYKFEEVLDNKFVIKSNNDFYIYVKDKYQSGSVFTVSFGDESKTILLNSNRVIYVENDYEIGTELEITVDGVKIENIYIAYIDFDNFVENYNELKNNQLQIKKIENGYINGDIEVSDKNVLFLSIQYNDNFKILVDGKETEYYKLFDNFIGLDLDEGLHNIEIIYEVKGLKLGFIISLISLSLFAIYSYRLKKVIK